TSCSENNNNDPAEETADVAGSYPGYTVASSRMFQNMVTPDENLQVTVASNGAVTVSLESESWGDILIENAGLTYSDNGYTLTGTGNATMGMGDSKKDYTCELSGRIANRLAQMQFSCPQVMGGLTIEFRQGDIPASLVLPGTYSGYTKASFQYAPEGITANSQTITIAATESGKFSISYVSDTWGSFEIPEAEASYENGAFKLQGTGTTMMGMGTTVSEYNCNMEGTIDVAKENPSITFTVPAVMGGLTIEFFPGTAPAE
ncbi:MAG: calycin-like domain-containing protein, partial [Muribaculaceae bacterium]|nr:calycin-like domain-containing protein [Muribaculaceae bacterium]